MQNFPYSTGESNVIGPISFTSCSFMFYDWHVQHECQHWCELCVSLGSKFSLLPHLLAIKEQDCVSSEEKRMEESLASVSRDASQDGVGVGS